MDPCKPNPLKDGTSTRTKPRQESVRERAVRQQQAGERKIRKLSPWNVFQRSEMEGRSFTKDAYAAEVKRLGVVWRGMSDDDKEPFQIEALHQQEQLDRLEEQPLAPATAQTASGGPEPQVEVWQNAAKKRSYRRLLLNKAEFEGHAVWNHRTCFGDSVSTWLGNRLPVTVEIC